MTKSNPKNEIEAQFPRWFYTIKEAAEKLNLTSEYLLHLGETARLEILWRISDLEMSFEDVQLNVKELPDGIIDVDFLPLRPKQVRSLKNEHLYFSEMYTIGLSGLVALSKYTTQKQKLFFKPVKLSLNYDFEIERDTNDGFSCDGRDIPTEGLYISSDEFERLKAGRPLNREQSAQLQQTDATLEERKLPKLTENKLYKVITAIAIDRLGIDRIRTAPRAAAQELLNELAQTGYGDVVSDQTLEGYLKEGLEQLHK